MKASCERHAEASLPPGKRQGVHCTGVGWALGPVWMCVVKLIPTGVRTPNRLACSELLHRLGCPVPPAIYDDLKFCSSLLKKNALHSGSYSQLQISPSYKIMINICHWWTSPRLGNGAIAQM
jgi:hypothetical protein